MGHCEQCDRDVDHVVAGICVACTNINYQRFTLWDAERRWWDKLTPAERDKLIKEQLR